VHRTAPQFWKRFDDLSEDIQKLARKNFDILKANSRHPSLHFKKVGDYWSARVGVHYRALAVEDEDDFIWVWIGSHAEYDKLVS
jgi:mRNA-degrading endonuclease RelE of RelBE toxin-antitoxin system